MNIILKTARIARGVTVKKLATALGITPAAYLELESQVRPITPKLAKTLSGYYSLPFYYFEDPPPEPGKRMHTPSQRISSLAQEDTFTSCGTATEGRQALMESLQQQVAVRKELKESLVQQVLLLEQLLEQLLDLTRLYKDS